MTSVDVGTSRGLRPGSPKSLFRFPEGMGLDAWDVSADGERFLLNVPVTKGASVPLAVVFNWVAGLTR